MLIDAVVVFADDAHVDGLIFLVVDGSADVVVLLFDCVRLYVALDDLYVDLAGVGHEQLRSHCLKADKSWKLNFSLARLQTNPTQTELLKLKDWLKDWLHLCCSCCRVHKMFRLL